MYQPSVPGKIIKVLSSGKTERRELSKPLVTFFAFVQIVFGYAFGFVKPKGSRKEKIVFRFITAVAGCSMTGIIILSAIKKTVGSSSSFITAVQYVPFFIILFCSKYTVCDFLTDLSNDSESIRKCHKADIFLCLYATLVIGAKTAAAVIYRSFSMSTDSHSLMIYFALHLPMIGLDFIPMANFIVFYYVYACLRDIVEKYERQETNLNELQNSLKTLSDNFYKFRCNYDAIFIWCFLTESIKWMLMIWNHLNLIKSSNSWWLHGCSYTGALISTIKIFISAVFAEMINVKNDAIKSILHKQLLNERDAATISGLQRLLRYVEARPLLRKAWRLVPVDLRQPVTMLSICITYLIVIIQFTHLFD